MINLRRLSIVALAAVLLAAPGAAKAQGTPDQSQTRYNFGAIVTGPEASWAQTFRAGLSGSLEVVDLVVDTAGDDVSDSPLVVELQSTSGGEPSGQVLAAASIPFDMVPVDAEWEQFRLDPAVPITAGTLYALTVRAPGVTGDSTFQWWFQQGDPYPDGGGWNFDQPGGWTAFGGEFAFQTYVNQAGVGAPGAPPDLAQRIAELKALLERLGLPPGLTERLQKMLDRVLAALPPGNTARANRSLRVFGNRVVAQRGKKLTVAQARRLSTATRALRASLALKRLEW
jgi:hypothetical protein